MGRYDVVRDRKTQQFRTQPDGGLAVVRVRCERCGTIWRTTQPRKSCLTYGCRGKLFRVDEVPA